MAFSLKAVLGLETTKFERGIDKARSKLNSSVKSMMSSLGPLVGFVGFSAMASSALNLAREVTNLSKVANASGEDFQKLAFGAKTVGVEQEKLADIYKDTGDKIGDFLQTGGGAMADFFENIAPKIGVTAEAFRELSGPDALQLYYDSLVKANLSQSEMTFYMEAIASDATLLIPLLADSGKGFKELGEQAEKAGLIMGDLEREKLEQVNLKMDVMKKRMTVLGGSLLTKIIPAIQILSNGLGFVGDIVGVAAANIVAFGKAVGEVITAVVTPAIKQIEALGYAIKAAGQFATGDFDGAKKSIDGAKQSIEDTVDAVKAIPGKLKTVSGDLANTMNSGFEVLGDSVGRRSAEITRDIDEIMGKNDELAGTLAKVKSAQDQLDKPGGTGGTGGTGGDDDKPKPGGTIGTSVSKKVKAAERKLRKGVRADEIYDVRGELQTRYFEGGRLMRAGENPFEPQDVSASAIRASASSGESASKSTNTYLAEIAKNTNTVAQEMTKE